MPIITTIRKFLRLDKTVVDFDKEFTNTVGLYPDAIKELYRNEYSTGCFADGHCILTKNELTVSDLHIHVGAHATF